MKKSIKEQVQTKSMRFNIGDTIPDVVYIPATDALRLIRKAEKNAFALGYTAAPFHYHKRCRGDCEDQFKAHYGPKKAKGKR